MSHLDDPDHARTPTSPRQLVTGSVLDNIAQVEVRGNTPDHLVAHQDGWEDAMALHLRTEDQSYSPWAYAGPPRPMPDLLKQSPVIPGSVTRAALEQPYLTGMYTFWFESGARWGAKHVGNIGALGADAFALPEDMFNRIHAGLPPVKLPTKGELGFTTNPDDEPTREDVHHLKWTTVLPEPAAGWSSGAPIQCVEHPAYKKWIAATTAAEAIQRQCLYRIAFLRGGIHGQELAKQLTEQGSRGGASAGIGNSADNK